MFLTGLLLLYFLLLLILFLKCKIDRQLMDRWAEFYIGVYPFLDDMIIKFFFIIMQRESLPLCLKLGKKQFTLCASNQQPLHEWSRKVIPIRKTYFLCHHHQPRCQGVQTSGMKWELVMILTRGCHNLIQKSNPQNHQHLLSTIRKM